MKNMLLVVGATLRLTRVVTTDDLGEWWIKDPLHELVKSQILQQDSRFHTSADDDGLPWWAKYRDGLDCPFCVGFWIGVAVLGSFLASRGTRWEKVWEFAATALSLNELVGHLAIRIGDTPE